MKYYRLFRRGKVFWSEHIQTKKQKSLRTRDPAEAQTLLAALNESARQPHLNLLLARVYLMGSDPQAAKRTWQDCMDEILRLKHGSTRHRWRTAISDPAFDLIRHQPIIESRAEHFLRVLERGKVSTNVFLRRIHNFALDMNWCPAPVIPKRQWPAVKHHQKRAITLEEHRRILAREGNEERRRFYELCWHLGGSQGDIAHLEACDIDWTNRVVSYQRQKSKEIAMLHFSDQVEAVLRQLPDEGPLFPYLRTVRAGDRATEFKQRCDGLGIRGVSLHSYRYAWAERAKTVGYPERFAQEALGHNSIAVHRAYAKRAKVKVPSLEDYEQQSSQSA